MKNGIINVYKEKGYTSFDVVAKMRGIMHQKKIGHTGSLDPDAEGVLPVCLGKATKVCDLLTDKDKVYETTMLLGMETDTQDISGKVINRSEVFVNEEEIIKTISSFVGKIMQVPPMYSALKINGQKLCDLARKGITVERNAREIEIFSIDIISINIPEVKMRVHCSKGTYIRTLCNDIGQKLGCFACMKELLRTKVSVFELENAIKLSEIQKLVDDDNFEFIIPVDSIFEDYPKVYAKAKAHKYIINGNKIEKNMLNHFDEKAVTNKIRLYTCDDIFVGIYMYVDSEKLFKPVKRFME